MTTEQFFITLQRMHRHKGSNLEADKLTLRRVTYLNEMAAEEGPPSILRYSELINNFI